MESDIEQGRALNMEEDKPSSPNKGKDIDVGSASENKMTGKLFVQLDTKVKRLPSQQDCFEHSFKTRLGGRPGPRLGFRVLIGSPGQPG